MKQYRITTGTVTYAIKGRDLLRRYGYKVKLERATSQSVSVGCGYSLIINGDLSKAEELLRGADVKILSVDEI
ncbi:MAG: DUF3343 domain-containing protein [Ruminococcaceae bacterium]|nr:DUF3343 domain-containing protein [Oscillospiraceae bacterium]